MNSIEIGVKKLEHFQGNLPAYESAGASGFDVRAQLKSTIVLQPGQRALVPTGLAFEIPLGFEIQVRARSGWALKKGIGVLNGPGTIDSDYRGELQVILINLGQESVEIQNQDRIAQLVLAPVLQARLVPKSELESSRRGSGGFGSTGT
jgi:dUTP pyrophosphatase